MRLRSAASRITLLTSALLSAAQARADTLVLRDSQVFGKLRAISTDTVAFSPGCGATAQTYPKANVKRIERHNGCTPRPISPYSAGGGVCATGSIQLFEVVLKNPSTTFLASDVSVTDDRVHIRSADGLTQIHGPVSRLVSIIRGLFCRSSEAQLPSPSGFCVETVQRAVNFGTRPVFSNQILTRGISFFLEDSRGRPVPLDDARGTIVRDAFGAASTNWMAALQDLGPRLPANLREGLSGMISSSPDGYTLLTPPQVVQVGCRDSAMFAVRWVSDSAAPMTIGGQVKAARAQVEGRTIWLNGKTFPCWRSSLTNGVVVPALDSAVECYNLVPVLIHEVGHALGLPGHDDDPARPSVMDSVISDAAPRPTSADALTLANVLSQQIRGAPAGTLAADAAGVELRVGR